MGTVSAKMKLSHPVLSTASKTMGPKASARDIAREAESGAVPGVRQESFESHDLDETRAYIGAKFGDRSRVPRGLGAFYYGHVVTDSGRAAVGKVRTLLPQTMRAAVQEPTLFLPLRAGDNYQIGRRTLNSGPLTAVLLAPGHDYTCHSPANDWVGLIVSGELLSEEIAARRRGRSRPWRPKSVETPLTASRKAQLMEFQRRMHELSVTPVEVATPGAIAIAERDAAAWLAGIIVERSGEAAISEPTQRRIERLERWVDAHLDETLTLDRLCAVSGTGGRALQKSVMTLRGQSPLEWVNARRLAAARAQLLKGPGRVAVSSVALDCGFTHLGRFSAAYRQAYGELPSATLAAARSPSVRRGNLRARPAPSVQMDAFWIS
jgi:AraC-like DNA-binding protein